MGVRVTNGWDFFIHYDGLAHDAETRTTAAGRGADTQLFRYVARWSAEGHKIAARCRNGMVVRIAAARQHRSGNPYCHTDGRVPSAGITALRSGRHTAPSPPAFRNAPAPAREGARQSGAEIVPKLRRKRSLAAAIQPQVCMQMRHRDVFSRGRRPGVRGGCSACSVGKSGHSGQQYGGDGQARARTGVSDAVAVCTPCANHGRKRGRNSPCGCIPCVYSPAV